MADAKPSPFRWTRATAEDREKKRAALLLAAARLFNERGFQATSLDDVASAVGVTKPVIYHYLGNKDRVLFECVQIGLRELQSAAALARAQPGSGLDRLKLFLQHYAEIIMNDFGRCVVRTGDELLAPDNRAAFRHLKRMIDTCLREMIFEATADGSASVPDVKLAALTIAGALNWPARWFKADGTLSAREMATAMVAILANGFERR